MGVAHSVNQQDKKLLQTYVCSLTVYQHPSTTPISSLWF